MSAELDAEQRAALADYHVLEAYDLRRSGRYGDMSRSRRGRELNRLADRLIDSGVPVDRTGAFPDSTPAELAAAFERVGRPRLRRLERETSPWIASDGTAYERRTRYNGASLDAWREVERTIAPPKPAAAEPIAIEVSANDGVAEALTLIVNGERVHGTLLAGVAARLADDGWNVPLLARITAHELPNANTLAAWIDEAARA